MGQFKGDRAIEKESEETLKKQFPIVAIGSSAGGIEALTEFFEVMLPNGNIAFVIVGHLDQDHQSFLPQIIQKHTKVKVKVIVWHKNFRYRRMHSRRKYQNSYSRY
ncbi:MAG: chemotaxis protein CheB [Oligoflexales bacterium]